MSENPSSAAPANKVATTTRSSYDGRPVALLTQHGKLQALAPVLHKVLGCTIELVSGYNTDLLGTFTRDIPRQGTQLEAARRKAQIGMALSGLSLGLASEGSFGADPVAGMFPWNVELLIWIDTERELEVIGLAQGNASFGHLLTGDWNAVVGFAQEMAFPSHRLVVRPASEEGLPVRKGIDTWSELQSAFQEALGLANNGLVFVESDVRAHTNPTRMAMIGLAAEDLAKKLSSLCPACRSPGFAAVELIRGLSCAACHAPTQEMRAEVFGCVKCDHRVIHERNDQQFADPGRCNFCNP